MLGAKRKLVVLVFLVLGSLLMWRASAILTFGLGMLIGAGCLSLCSTVHPAQACADRLWSGGTCCLVSTSLDSVSLQVTEQWLAAVRSPGTGDIKWNMQCQPCSKL